MVFHVLINRLGAHLKHVRSGDHGATCDCVDNQSLGRSCDTFPGSCACISRDPKVIKMSYDQTCNRSCDGFPGSHACISHDPKVIKMSCDGFPGSHGRRVDSTT